MSAPHRLGVIETHLMTAARHRTRAEEMVDSIEVLTAKMAEIPVIPLDVLDRYERCIVKAHAANLLRLPAYASFDEGDAA